MSPNSGATWGYLKMSYSLPKHGTKPFTGALRRRFLSRLVPCEFGVKSTPFGGVFGSVPFLGWFSSKQTHPWCEFEGYLKTDIPIRILSPGHPVCHQLQTAAALSLPCARIPLKRASANAKREPPGLRYHMERARPVTGFSGPGGFQILGVARN